MVCYPASTAESTVATDKQLAALEPTKWRPGQSGNPAGRRPNRPLTQAYDEILRSPVPEAERKAMRLAPGVTWAQAIAQSKVRQACRHTGNSVPAAKEMRESVEGKSVQRIELSGERSVQVNVVFDDPPPAKRRKPLDAIDADVIDQPLIEDTPPKPEDQS
jgi:hypothetical protein